MTEQPDDAAVQRHVVRTVALSNALGGVGVTMGIAVASLLMVEVSGTETYAGVVQTMQVLGTAVLSWWLARVMAVRGRRAGLVGGYALGTLGAIGMVVAGAVGSVGLLLAAAVLFGAASASNSQSRFAATDLATDAHRGRDLSLVVWATTIGAVAGPNLADAGGTLATDLGLPPLTGPFLLTAVALTATGLIVQLRLRPDPLLLARRRAVEAVRGAALHETTQRAPAPVAPAHLVVRRRPAVAAAIASNALAHAVMVSVMIMTPVHMHHGAATLRLIGLTISGHILGMYAFSPLVGRLVDRVGPPRTVLVGAGVILVAVLMSATAAVGASWWLGTGLFLLGLGWSLCLIAGSTLITAATPSADRAPVQGLADLVLGLTSAAGGALAGVVVAFFGYPVLALTTLPAVAAIAACALVAARAGQPDARRARLGS